LETGGMSDAPDQVHDDVGVLETIATFGTPEISGFLAQHVQAEQARSGRCRISDRSIDYC
jgi:hypothetical protein